MEVVTTKVEHAGMSTMLIFMQIDLYLSSSM